VKEMKKIWYLLKCPEENETGYIENCLKFMNLGEMEEVICFRYQRMIRYGGKWHLENRMALPGCIFLSRTDAMTMKSNWQGNTGIRVSYIPCETPYLKKMCWEGNLVGMSRGIIRNEELMVTSGPLKGRERLIRKIDRHKRTAQIEIPLAGDKRLVTVGLEIYKKEI